MPGFQINCINKPDRNSPHEHITHVGNSDAGWKLTRDDAIKRIENKTDTFYTIDVGTGKRVTVDVYREAGKMPFLRTHADGKWNDNLLAQSTCGANCKLIS